MIYIYIKRIRNRLIHIWWAMTTRMFCKYARQVSLDGHTYKSIVCENGQYRSCTPWGCPKRKYEIE